MMMKHLHEHMLMHRKHMEKAHRAHMMAMGLCCVVTLAVGAAAVCLAKSKCGKEMREHIKNTAMETAESFKEKLDQKVGQAKAFVTDVKEKAAEPGADI